MAANDSEQLPQIAWQEAEVHDRELHVALSMPAPRGWAARFRTVLARLAQDGDGRWGRVSVSRRELKVADVAEGGEGDLRHLLESVLMQVNADLAEEEERPAELSAEQQRDERLSETFRGFAGR
jgi:hypothetical protein